MTFRRSLCLSFAVAISAALPLAAMGELRWAPLGPPAGPSSARVVVAGGQAYALSEAGLWRSKDGAGSWSSIQAGLGQAPVAFAADPSRPGRIFASVLESSGGDSFDALYRSDDFGGHWKAVVRTPGASPSLQDLEVDPFSSDSLVRQVGGSLFRSDDGGRTWACLPVGGTEDNCGFRATLVSAFTFAPDRPGTLYALGNDGLYTTHDGGRTWTPPAFGGFLGSLETLVATRVPRTLFAWSRDPYFHGDSIPCFARSNDEGVTWERILPHRACGTPAVDAANPGTVRMVVASGDQIQLWVSKNGGDTWSSAGNVPELGDLYTLPGGGFALATNRGFFRAPSERGPWRPANRGFAASQVTAVLASGGAVLAAEALPINGVRPPEVPLRRTVDGGRSWLPAGLVNPIGFAADPNDPQRLIASALRYVSWSTQHPRVLESLDGGGTWRGVVDPQIDPPLLLNLTVDPFDSRAIYGGTQYAGFQVSLDGGRTWRASNAGLPPGKCPGGFCESPWVHKILADLTQEGRLVIHYISRLFESLDGGLNWTPLRPQAPSAGTIAAVTRDAQGAWVAVGSGTRDGDAASLGVVYRSIDQGATWTRQGRLIPLDPSRNLRITGLVATQGALWLSTNLQGVLRSTDGGRTWKAVNDGLPIPSVTSLTVDASHPGRLFAAVQGNGVYTLQE